jgi:hypothetical protein
VNSKHISIQLRLEKSLTSPEKDDAEYQATALAQVSYVPNKNLGASNFFFELKVLKESFLFSF